MNTRLLFFEGPPGGGKSSLSQFVAKQLQSAGATVQWIEEQPLNAEVFDAFYAAIQNRPDLAPSDVIAALLAGWQSLLERLHNTSTVLCLDGAFHHSTLKLLHAHDYSQMDIDSYLQQLYASLRPFAPTLIQVTGDVPRIMNNVIDERGALWADAVASDVACYPCQLRRQLTGIDGMIRFFEDSQRQLEAIAATYPFAYRRIDTTAREWATYEQLLCTWLNLPQAVPHVAQDALDLTQYTGVYQAPDYFPPQFKHPFHIELMPDGLRLHMIFMRNFRLIADGADRFAIAGRPLQVEFVRDARGAITGAIYPFVPDQRFFCVKSA